MRFLTAVLCALALVGCAPRPEIHASDFSQIRAATKQLDIVNAEGTPMGHCSAVAIDEHTLLTAAHCDAGAAILVNGYRVLILKKDETRDLLLLHVPAGMACPCVSAAVDNPAQDSKVYVVGFPLSVGQVVTEGRFETEVNDGFVIFTAPVAWGNSGGGVFARRADGWVLVGIVSHLTVLDLGIPIVVWHLNYAAGAASIYKFITNV